MLLNKPPFTLVVGDVDEDREALRKELFAFLEENGDKPKPGLPLSMITQRWVLRFGEVAHKELLSMSAELAEKQLASCQARVAPAFEKASTQH